MTERIREQLTQVVAEAEALARRAQWVAEQGAPVDRQAVCRALMACDVATEALARAGASGPPEHADRAGNPCPSHPGAMSEAELRDAEAYAQTLVDAGRAKPARPVCCVCGGPAKAFVGGQHYCNACELVPPFLRGNPRGCGAGRGIRADGRAGGTHGDPGGGAAVHRGEGLGEVSNNPHAGHEIVKCRACGAVVMQCRCFFPGKPTRWIEACAECKKKERTKP